MKLFGSIKELVKVVFRQNGQEIELDSNQGTTYTGTRLHQLPPGDSSQTLVSETATQTLSGKSIDADNNTITNIENAEIKAGAAIDTTKLADGSVDNTEFQKLGTAGTAGAGNLVTTDGTQTLTGKTIDGDDNTVQDLALASLKNVPADSDKVLKRNLSGAVVSVNPVPNDSDLVTIDATQTLTNKDIDGDDNSVSDLPITAIKTVLGDANKVLRRNASGVPESGNTLPNSSAIVTIDSADTLTNKTLTSPAVNGQNVDYVEFDTQGSDPASPGSAGDLRLYAKLSKLYTKDSSGNVIEVGTGSGSGGVNYITNGSATTDTTGWATYADAAGSVPVDGTGGSPNVTFTRNTTTPLRGTADFKLAKDAANRQGQGVSYAFTIDSADVSKSLQISCDFNFDGSYAANDVACYIYDVTNSTLIYTASPNLAAGKYTYQTAFVATTSTSYRLIFHVATTNASAYNIYLDNVQVGPVIAALGIPFSDTQSITPTFSAGFGTVTNIVGRYEQYGGWMHLRLGWLNGTTAGSAAQITLPAEFTIDFSRLYDNTGAQRNYLGEGYVGTSASGGTGGNAYVVYGDSDLPAVLNLSNNTSGTAFDLANGTTIFAANTRGFIDCWIPISQWAGSSAFISQARPEYVYNSGTWDSDNSTTFSYGPEGQAMAGALGGTRTKRVRFLTPIQATDKVEVQVSADRRLWYPAIGGRVNGNPILPSVNSAGNVQSGITWREVSASTTDVDVIIGEFVNVANDDVPTSAWPSSNGFWRVVKIPGNVQVSSPTTVKYQEKVLATSVTATGTVTGLSFSNLTVGQTYKISGALSFSHTSATANDKSIEFEVLNGATRLAYGAAISTTTGATTTRLTVREPVDVVFIATNSALTLSIISNSNMSLLGDSSNSKSSTMRLENVSTHTATTEWA